MEVFPASTKILAVKSKFSLSNWASPPPYMNTLKFQQRKCIALRVRSQKSGSCEEPLRQARHQVAYTTEWFENLIELVFSSVSVPHRIPIYIINTLVKLTSG